MNRQEINQPVEEKESPMEEALRTSQEGPLDEPSTIVVVPKTPSDPEEPTAPATPAESAPGEEKPLPRIISEMCEFCGVKAVECQHAESFRAAGLIKE